MKKNMIAFCDSEDNYREEFMNYLKQVRELPFDVAVFSDTEELKEFCSRENPQLLVLSERVYEEELEQCGNVVVLDESPGGTYPCGIHKYQSADTIVKELTAYYMEKAAVSMAGAAGERHSKLIGIYSPIKRCLQTSTALVLGQLLAKEKRVLYLNFEHYSGFRKLTERDFAVDLIDLIYYMKHAKEKLIYRLQSMIQTINGLDYIPPAVSFQDMNEIPAGEWLELLDEIGRNSRYDYLILDLNESLAGIFEILQSCDYIYTIEKNDGMAYAKISQYEELLMRKEYTDILEKTKKVQLPYFRHLPLQIEQLLYSELAEYMKTLIQTEGL